MKVCFIIHDVTARAGSERAQANLVNALVSRGDAIAIWSCYGRGQTPGFPLSPGVDVHYGSRAPLRWFVDYPLLMLSFAAFIIRFRPQWIVCTDTNRLIVAVLAVLVPGVRIAVWEHFSLLHSATKARGRLARRLAAVVASHIVTLTERDVELWAELFSPTCQVSMIPNIVLQPVGKAPARRKEVLAVGRLVPQKGFDLLLKAWSRACEHLPEWTLRIVGDGEMRAELIVQARRLGIEQKVVFEAFVENPSALYMGCGLFVLSSRFEGLPYVLIEAMACGASCISFDCPTGPRELIQDGINGVLIPAENVAALADSIVELAQNPHLRQRLGKAAQASTGRFSEERAVRLWKAVLCD